MGKTDFTQCSMVLQRFLAFLALHLIGERAVFRKTLASRMNKGRT
jgi:hypothetical protein